MIRFLLLAQIATLAVDSPEMQMRRSCSTRSGVQVANEACRPLDLDCDGDVDQDDFGLAQREMGAAPSPQTQPASTSRPWIYPAGCACVESGSPGGAAMTCQVWVELPADLQEELQTFMEHLAGEVQRRSLVVPIFSAQVRDSWTAK